MSSVAVIILNWNGIQYLKQFLPSVVRHTPSEIASIIVADNGSTDDSISWVKEHFPGIRMMDFATNLGYAGGYSKALDKINEPFAVLLNSDVEVGEGWLEPLLHTMTEKSVGAVMPRILSYHQPTHFEYAGAAGGLIDRFGYPFCRGRIFAFIEPDQGQYNTVEEIFWASGACLMIRMEAYHQAGGFDPIFFAHMEEIDLCWRMQLRNFRVLYQPGSKILHLGGGSLPNEHPRKIYLNFRNNLLLLWKNLPASERPKRIQQRKWLDGLAVIQYLLKGQFRFIRAIFLAHMDFRKLRSSCSQTNLEYDPSSLPGWYNRSIVWDYFIRRKKGYSELAN